jgi:uncharacterized protein
MDAISIPQLLKMAEQRQAFEFREHLASLETLTPVQGHLSVRHCGGYLEVTGSADTIVTLACHRCLQHYNHRLQLDASELIWLEEPEPPTFGAEVEVDYDDLVETLPPNGLFHPDNWIYQQLCLAIPHRQLCDRNCSGIDLSPEIITGGDDVDRRWAGLAALKQQLGEAEPPR